MIGYIPMEKPRLDSLSYYKYFYHMYSLLQINDVFVFETFNDAMRQNGYTTKELLDAVNPENHANELNIMFLGMQLKPPANIIRMSEEDRGTDTTFARKLENPFEWFRNINEFTQLYAIFEQSLTEYLASGYDVVGNDVINNLVVHLDNNNMTDMFLNEFHFKTFEIIESVDEMKAVWAFYTKVRNCIAHSGGRITKKNIADFNGVKGKYNTTLNAIEHREWLCNFHLLNKEYSYTLFNRQYTENDMLQLDYLSLNFFRMFCVFCIETLNKIQIQTNIENTAE